MEDKGQRKRKIDSQAKQCESVVELAAHRFPGWDPKEHTLVQAAKHEEFVVTKLQGFKVTFKAGLGDEGGEGGDEVIKARAAMALGLGKMVSEAGEEVLGQLAVEHPAFPDAGLVSDFGLLSTASAMALVEELARLARPLRAPLHAAEFFVYRWDPQQSTDIQPTTVQKFAGGPVYKKGFKVSLDVNSGGMSHEEQMMKAKAGVTLALEQMVAKHGKDAIGQVIVKHPKLHTTHLATKFAPFSSFAAMELVDKFGEAQNSEDSKKSDEDADEVGLRLEDAEFFVLCVEPEEEAFGGFTTDHRLSKRRKFDIAEFLKSKMSLVNPIGKRLQSRLPKEGKDWCMAICCVLGKLRADNENLSNAEFKRFHEAKAQLVPAVKKLLTEAGVEVAGPHTIFPDLQKIQAAMSRSDRQGYQICCWFDDTKPKHAIGPDEGKQIHVFFSEELQHCWLITNVIGFLAPRYSAGQTPAFCRYCKSLHVLQAQHRCSKSSCPLCQVVGCANKSTKKYAQHSLLCDKCGRHFWTGECLEAHEAEERTCASRKRCERCFAIVDVKRAHKCGMFRCDACRTQASFDHVCFMQPDKAKDEETVKPPMKRWYGDIESTVDENGIHKANLLILKQSNGHQPRYYSGPTCIRDFIQEAVIKQSDFANSYLIFHNLSGYDGHFFVDALLAEGYKPPLLLRQQSILSLDFPTNNIKMRDSLLFIPGTPLSKLPSMYGVPATKGFFPHLLNKDQYLAQPYFEEGGKRFPPQAYFEPMKMKSKGKREFRNWWVEEEARFRADPSLRYVVWDELIKYCEMDVEVLLQAFEKFRLFSLNKNPGLDPLDSITTPSYCNRVFREKHMLSDSIALLPPEGFSKDGHGTSKEELAWLAWMKKKLDLVELRHNRNFRPITIAGYKIDGYGKDSDGNAYVLEYHGCRFHGCDKAGCLAGPVEEDEAERRISSRLLTAEKKRRLMQVGQDPESPYGQFTYVEIWGHEAAEQMARDPEMADFIKRYKAALSTEALSLRKGFAGGRTSVITHRVEGNVGYADFTSLYPSVNACSEEDEEYPVGYPTVLLGTELQETFGPDLEAALLSKDLFGVVHCTVDPPLRLRHAVVPMHVKGKLLFPLCRTCALEENQETCEHSPSERRLRTHLPTPELKMALEMGYRLHRVFEAWHFPRSQRSKQLLAGFVMDHYIDKEYASGFPPGCDSEEQKKAYAQRCSEILGVPVDWTKFEKNNGLRSLYKLFNNNFWGFFGKREDTSSSEFVNDFQRLMALINDPEREVVGMDLSPNSEHILVETKPKEEKPGLKSSLLLASFTTSMARTRLYKVLRDHSEAIIYMDTDSVFYLKTPEDSGPLTPGDFGKLKDEIETAYPGVGARILSFVCIGNKSYGYIVVDRDGNILGQDVKMKGISITAQSEPLVNHDAMAKLIESREPVYVPQMQFKKNLKKLQVETRDYLKKMSFVSTKRRFLANSESLDTVPYGYVDL